MGWLSGKPLRTCVLTWPAADTDLTAHHGTIRRREGSSAIDELIVYWIALRMKDGVRKTVVYAADTTRTEEGTDEIKFERVAELDYAVYRLALVPQVGFATVEWLNQENAVKFRSHSLSGTMLHELNVPVQAAYGNLSLFGSTVSLCVGSGDPVPGRYENIGSDIHFYRLDYLAGYTNDLPLDLIADEILTWDAARGDLRRIRIPFDSHSPMTHCANFQYLSSDKIALAGCLSEPPSGVLMCFSTEGDVAEVLSFSHGQHMNPESINRSIARPGSTDASQIIVHPHDGEGRITVFKRDLLLGNIPSIPTSNDPESPRMVFSLHNDSRTLPFSLDKALPSVSGNRILVKRDVGAIWEPSELYILDFDQERLAALATAESAKRAALRASLEADGARVKAVTRRFYVNVVSKVDDMEYPWPEVPPQAWEEHLDELLNREDPEDSDDDDDDGDAALAGDPLEFDEAPEEHRDPVPFGYVQTRLQFGGAVDGGRVAIMKHAVIEMPEPGKEGRVFHFE
ncbi:hypothetical protein M0805_001975 [Coniferiporia weirii]|nr:hypothetical protein M0805_001975 [Coniferiporia weirii]